MEFPKISTILSFPTAVGGKSLDPQINVLPYTTERLIPVLFGLVSPSSGYSCYFRHLLHCSNVLELQAYAATKQASGELFPVTILTMLNVEHTKASHPCSIKPGSANMHTSLTMTRCSPLREPGALPIQIILGLCWSTLTA